MEYRRNGALPSLETANRLDMPQLPIAVCAATTRDQLEYSLHRNTDTVSNFFQPRVLASCHQVIRGACEVEAVCPRRKRVNLRN